MEKTSPPKEWVLIQRILAEPPPFVSAKSWVVADGKTGEVIFGRGENESREIASLTKIMTAYTSLKLAEKFQLELNSVKILISEKASNLGGTKAYVEEGDQIVLRDLLYGMMLPSGNDAALALAEFFGNLIRKTIKPPDKSDIINEIEPPPIPSAHKLFVKEMNKIAKELGLTETCFANPHGLINFNNRSSAQDIAKLSSAAMSSPQFREIVKCRKYTCKAVNGRGEEKAFNWKNTNKLLSKGYNGVKTGITPSAGPCLATSIECDGLSLVVVILNSKSMDQRWIEVKKLTKWAKSRIKKIEEISQSETFLDKKKIIQMLTHV